jgi:hypothetical protein
MTLQLRHSEFPYTRGKFDFLFISALYILYVQVPKAASTSWLFAYLQMAGVPEQEIPDVR